MTPRSAPVQTTKIDTHSTTRRMQTPRFLPASLLALSLGLLAFTSRAGAQTVITALPYTITASGHYTINGNLTSTSTTQPAITISAPNVILDLNGYFVAGPGNPAANSDATSSVINVGNYANVTIENGTVAGNTYGIFFAATTIAASRNYLVDSVVVTRCYDAGVWFDSDIGATGSVVRRCSFSTIGNSTYGSVNNPSAIYTYGGVRIENNTIGGITATGSGASYGINAASGDYAIGNTITGCTYGIFNGKYLNNLTYGCTTPFLDGVNATGNN